MANIALIAKAFLELAPMIISIVKLFSDAKKNGWIKDGQELRSQVQKAQTDEERMALAKRLFEHSPR